MNVKLRRLFAAGALSSAIVVFSGCATTEELAAVRKIAEDAQTSANSAAASATQAQQTASDASAKADKAMQAAGQAQACCNANSERMERMFQRSMSK